jgi:hypothetical protein
MIVLREQLQGAAIGHLADHKYTVLHGGPIAVLTRIARELDTAGHCVRLVRGDGFVEWPDITTAAAGLAAEPAPLPVPTVSPTWR